MKVLHVVPTLGIGGVERLLLQLLPQQRAAGVMSEIAFLKPPTDLRIAFEKRDVPTHDLEAPTLRSLPLAARRLRQLARRMGMDLLHSHLLQGDLVTRLAAGHAWPHVRAQHNVEHALNRRYVRWFYRRLLTGTAPLITPSNYVAKDLIARCREPRTCIHVIPYGIDPPRVPTSDAQSAERAALRQAWGISNEQRVALILARFAEQKGQLELLHALRSVPPQSAWTWVFVGAQGDAAYATRIERSLANHPWRDRIRIVPPSLEPESCLRAADVLCMPSRWEGFGLVALEAMLAGTPVIAHDLPVLREVLAETALYVPLFDAEAWLEALASISEDASATLARTQTARVRAHTHFSSQRMCSQLQQLYEQVLGSR